MFSRELARAVLMQEVFKMRFAIIIAATACLICSTAHAANKITFDSAGNLVVNGETMFPISIALPPPPDGKTPDGKDAYAELYDSGVMFFRVPPPDKWDDAGEATIARYLDVAAAHKMYGWISLRGIDAIAKDGSEQEQTLRRVIAKFKDHPGAMGWKGKDEPAWGKPPTPVESVIRTYKIIKQADNNNLPVTIGQAPKFTAETLAPYSAGCDFTGEDIFPIGYPLGKHSDMPNKQISVVGDETKKIVKAAGGKPVWMTLQIAWSGVSRPEQNTLRFPTFPEERYMTYEAIINGARGLNYFGGTVEQDMTPQDKSLGWNWRFWDRVLHSVIEEINDKSPLHPALIAPNSKLPIKVTGATDVEFCVREADKDLFIIASKREGETVEVKFTGLPADAGEGEVMYEPPRTVTAKAGAFTDWFGPNEVHVYRFHRP